MDIKRTFNPTFLYESVCLHCPAIKGFSFLSTNSHPHKWAFKLCTNTLMGKNTTLDNRKRVGKD